MNIDEAREVLSKMVWKLDGAAAKFDKPNAKKTQILVLSKKEVEALLIIVLQQKGY
jgi:hypothetical protein